MPSLAQKHVRISNDAAGRKLRSPLSVLPRKKQSSRAPQEGPVELEEGQGQAKPGSELGVLPSRVPAAHAGSGKETKDPPGMQKDSGMVEGQAPESCQVTGKTGTQGR